MYLWDRNIGNVYNNIFYGTHRCSFYSFQIVSIELLSKIINSIGIVRTSIIMSLRLKIEEKIKNDASS